MQTRPFPRPWFPCLGLLLLLPAASADDGWDREPREPTLQASTDEFHYVAAHELPSGRDWIEADFLLRSAELHFGFVSTDPAAPTRLAMDARVLAVDEFIDRDGDGALDIGDTTVQRVSLASLGAGATLATQPVAPASSSRAPSAASSSPAPATYQATAHYPVPVPTDAAGLPLTTDSPRPGGLEIRFSFSPEVRSGAGVTLLPTQVRYDVHVVDFPYRSNESRLAIELELTATGQPAVMKEGFAARAEPYEVSHRWTRSAVVDGSHRPVAVTLVQPEGGPAVPRPEAVRVAYLAVPRGQDIQVDPVFEVERAEAATSPVVLREVLGDGRLFVLALGLSGLVVGAATLVRLRRR